MSYYRQKGVEPGLARKINQGLSARVKTDEAYANTRLNNDEFKNANQLAAIAFNSVPNRKRGMMVNFAIAEMTKRALEAIKAGSGAWGDRRPAEMADVLLCDMLEYHAKGGAYDSEYGNVSHSSYDAQGQLDVNFNITEELATSLKEDGIDAITFVVQQVGVGITATGVQPFAFGGRKILTVENQSITAGTQAMVHLAVVISGAISLNMSPGAWTNMLSLANYGTFAVVSILPARSQGGNLYTLQEKCTFVAIPLGKLPTP